MRRTTLAIASLAVLMLMGCPDADKNESIELTVKGVDAFNNESHSRAIQYFKDAVAKNKKNHAAWYSMGEVLGRQKDWKEAAEAYREAVKHHGSDEMYQMRLGQSLYEMQFAIANDKKNPQPIRNLKNAEAALKEAIKQNKDLFKAYWYLGRIYRDTDRPKEAAKVWTTACSLNPMFGKPFAALGELYLRFDRYEESIRVLKQGTQYVVGNEDKTNVFHNLGRAYDAKARANKADQKELLDKAIAAYTDALAAKSDNQHSKLMRGMAYAKKGEASKAQADLNAFLKRGAGTPFERQEATKAMYSLAVAKPM